MIRNASLLVVLLLFLASTGCGSSANGPQTTEPPQVASSSQPNSTTDARVQESPSHSSTCPEHCTGETPCQIQRILADNLFPAAEVTSLVHNWRIPGNVPLIKQRSPMGCWATVCAMMYGWKTGKDANVTDYLKTLPATYAEKYDADNGLKNHEKTAFLRCAGLEFEYGMSYLPTGLESLLRRYGPIWFTITNEDGIDNHATIVIGLIGTGKMEDTYVIYIDPKYGEEGKALYPDFMKRYENVASLENETGEPPSFQVLHYPES